MMKFEYRIVSSLEKVFCKPEFQPDLPLPEHYCFHAARNERFHCQLIVKGEENITLRLSASQPEGIKVTLRETGLVPCDMPGMPGDPDMLVNEPGLFPDPLYPITEGIRLTRNNWHSIWITAEIATDCAPGIKHIELEMEMIQTPGCPWKFPFELKEKTSFDLEVHNAVLPEQKLICTNWFYCDCIAEYYHVKPWSRAFWRIVENYWRDMALHGRNMLLTPLWTPPLDTEIGGERPTVQLLQIALNKGKWSFDFSRLKEYICRAQKCGITYFEMSHLFTQWGAKATPKILVSVDGVEQKYFGWGVASTDSKYESFLAALLPELAEFFRREKMAGKVFFHISDEPPIKSIEQYKMASALVQRYLPMEEYPIFDALSDVEFFKQGLLNVPVPVFNHLEKFADIKPYQKWCYYAGSFADCPGRAYGMPSRRNRIMGVLLYITQMEGFLHWGHNFWFTQYSRDTKINPYLCTTAGRAFCGGNSYNVYPGKDRMPVDSLIYENFSDGLQDLRLLQLFESKFGRTETLKEIQAGLDYLPCMTHFPHDAAYLENLKLRLLRKLD